MNPESGLRLARVCALLALIVVSTGALAMRRRLASLAEGAAWVGHTHEVLRDLDAVKAELAKAETSPKAFADHSKAARRAVETLRRLTSDTADQQDELRKLELLLDRRDAAARAQSNEIINRMGDRESGRLHERVVRQEATVSSSWKIELTTRAMAVFLMGLAFLQVRRESGRRATLADELRRQRDLLQAVIDGADSGIYLKDRDCRFVMANQEVAEVLSTTVDNVIGKDLSSFFSAETARKMEELDRRVLQSGRPETSELLVPFASKGRVRTFLVSNTPFKDPSGAVVGVVGVSRDVTEERDAQEQVREAKSFLESVIEHLPAMLFIKDAEQLRFTRFNRAGEELLGIGRDELLGKSDRDLFPAEQADFFIAKDREVLAKKTVLDISEEAIQSRSQGTRWLHTRKIPIFGAGGEPSHLLGISEDITVRKLAEAQLLEGAQMKADFAAMVSHELRTPLASIKMALDIVLDGVIGAVPEAQRQALATAQRNVDRLGRLINEVLDFQKLEAGHMEFKMAPCELTPLVLEVAQTFSPVAKQRGLQIETRCALDLGSIVCDRDKVTQVLTNLVSNALKFGERGTVHISAERKGGFVRLSVQDEGPGISPQDQAKLFQSFVQLTGLDRKPGGTG
ncbi:MAG: PAS domain-containing protein, partial [Elusimicrobia bacterium]|nr:PAS domain-containing protein [Elusimicrobiota bacterium]